MTLPDLSDRTQAIFRQTNTILLDQHFVYISGDHGSGWINKDALLPKVDIVCELAGMLAEAIKAVKSLEVDVICGPAIGGLVVSQWVSYHMKLPSVFTEHAATGPKGEGAAASVKSANPGADAGTMRPPFVLKRGFEDIVRCKRVLIVDDIVNTGLSIRQTVNAVTAEGAHVIGAAAYCSRGNAGLAELTVPEFVYLTEIKIPSWPASQCQLCRDGVPINTEYAHGRDFLLTKR